ncbi:carbamoyl phosphate synthase small subunit [Verrucomicrobia bacterium LW23]|nr:carbamoyl phosphate synthase small subunit [Verrucomicrobia bacterium LW23]
MKAILALENGTVYHGEAFGAPVTSPGEVCFNTSMTGYQEILTDPSYRGQIVTMTYPHIGNYGVNELDNESDAPQVSGFVVRELCGQPSSWRSRESLDSYLRRHHIPGLAGIDTRALTKLLRVGGAVRGVITSENISDKAAVALAREFSYLGRDFVKEITCAAPYDWDPEDKLSRKWSLVRGTRPSGAPPLTGEDYLQPLPPVKHNIVAYDFGIKKNILRRLRQHGFKVRVVPATTTPEKALESNPDGIFLSPGPGDPEALTYMHDIVRGIVGKKPLFGICLGHQVVSYALGGKTFKLKFGHRGGNQPVKDLTTGRVAITSQNHGFAVDSDTLPKEVEVTHVNLNDNTCEGLRHRELPLFSVQYHPEASPGPHDASYFFEEFSKMIDKSKS